MMGRNHRRKYIAVALLFLLMGCAKGPADGGTPTAESTVDVPAALMAHLKDLSPAQAAAGLNGWEIPGVAAACTGVPELIACQWGPGANAMTDGRLLLWQENGVWKSQPYPPEAVRGVGYFVRLEKIGTDVAVIMNVAGGMTMGTEQVQVLRYEGGAWRVAWLPLAAAWTKGHATVSIHDTGFTVNTNSYGMESIFVESNAGDHRPFVEQWVREGEGYVRKSSEEVPSDYGAVVHFVEALVKGDDAEALRWAQGPEVVKQARNLGIPQQKSFFTRREGEWFFRLHTNTPSEMPQWLVRVDLRGPDRWVVAAVTAGAGTAGVAAAPRPEVVHAVFESNPLPDAFAFATNFADEQVGWLAAENLLRMTTDGGRTWRDLHTFDDIIYGTQMVSRSVGFVATNKGLHKTTNGGQTWARLTDDTFLYSAFDFVGEQTGWKRVYKQGYFATTDGGKTWTALPDGPCDGSFSFVSPQTGWLLCATGGGAGLETKDIYRTDDGARTWRRVATDGGWPGQGGNLPLGSYLSSFEFLDENHGWIGEAKGGLIVTHDGGATWERLPPTGEVNGDLQFFTPERGYAVLTQHYQQVSTLVATTDGGKTWTPVYPVAPADPTSAKFVTNGEFWVALGTVANPSAILMREDGEGWRQVGVLPELPPSFYPR
ncbi:MAG: C-terminal target protein, partial [Symbiobacteriaceae bacterium]|nr:C-terminal target protein [Symbiobacteriaceae bacterium]